MKTDLNMQKNNDSRAEQGSSTARTQECATKTNRLITSELQKRLADYPLYSQDGKHKDALCIAVFYLGNIRWYIMKDSRKAMTLRSMASLLDCKRRSTATSL